MSFRPVIGISTPEEKWDFLSSEKTHAVAILLAAGITEAALWLYPPTRVVAVLPGVSTGTWVALHEAGHWAWESSGLRAPFGSSPTRTTPASKRLPPSQKRSSSFRSKGMASVSRGKCPKGHYWSYREKKCVKSKFR